ncbi:GNAT family N-acetyltransferase [Angustibacter aerolatus]
MRIVQATTSAEVDAAADLFDAPPLPDATARFLADPGHHLLLAHDGDQPVGFVSGVEMVHPDKGTELLVSELGVAESHHRRGIGTALVEAIVQLAAERGCHGVWVAVDPENDAALATYRRAGADRSSCATILDWDLPR